MRADLARAHAELEDAHRVLDALGESAEVSLTVASRIRLLVLVAVGERAAAVLETEPARTLARAWLETSGHTELCTCNRCRAARRLG